VGWRYLLFTLGGLTLIVCFLRCSIFKFQESPKFLLYRGQDQKAIEALQNIAKYNGRKCALTIDKLEALGRDFAPTHINEEVVTENEAKQHASTGFKKLKAESARFKILFADYQMTRLTLLVWSTYVFDYWGFSVAGKFLPPF
jgi:hypothetical protein